MWIWASTEDTLTQSKKKRRKPKFSICNVWGVENRHPAMDYFPIASRCHYFHPSVVSRFPWGTEAG